MTTTSDANRPGWAAALRERLANSRRRTVLYVEPRSQRAVIGYLMLMIAFGAAAGVGTMSLLESLAEVYVWYATKSGPDAWISRGLVFAYQIAFVLIVTIIAFVLALGFSHRIGGPVRLIHQALDRIAYGDLRGTLRLREDDLLKDLASSVNASASGLTSSFREIERSVSELRAKHDMGEDLEGALVALEAAVGRFETDPPR